MSAFLSTAWYRVAQLMPRVKPQARVTRQRLRGAPWYVLHDPASPRVYRLTPAAWQVLAALDGQRSVDAVWQETAARLGEHAPGQDEIIGLLAQLYAADLLLCDVDPDAQELFERAAQERRRQRSQRWNNPLSVRVALWDPDAFLARTAHYVAPLFGRAGALLYGLVVGAALLQAAIHFPDLTENFGDRVLSAQNLLALSCIFPAVKFLHELGHGYATKLGGGEVHEMGILFLVLFPVPYVDASSANAFHTRRARLLVAAAGMLVETFLAALALFAWLALEPGWLRACAFDVMLIAGISTVLFNGNPLLRYDGYYMLSDLIEMPNLAPRAAQYWRHLLERHGFGLTAAEAPHATRGERIWFLLYAPLALAYRLAVTFAILLFVAGKWFFVGVVLALWAAAVMIVRPVFKFLRYVTAGPRLTSVRRRAVLASAVAVGGALIVLGLLPLPHRILAEGVVWLPEDAQVRAGANGFVSRILVPDGSQVEAGTALVETYDPAVAAQVVQLRARVEQSAARVAAELMHDRVQTRLAREELARDEAALAHAEQQAVRLVATSAAEGRFVLPQPQDLPGRYLQQGQLIGYVLRPMTPLVRAVVRQQDIDLVRGRLRGAEVRLAGSMADTLAAALVREVPAAHDQLPSVALGSAGGGALAADPRDSEGRRALETVFQFDLELPAGAAAGRYGERAHVRFELAPEPLLRQMWRRLRQVFLSHFDV
ncbi:MAG: peptidase M50 [Rhodocyclaceae bacterium]|nr:peptidase M50 [Rhodocyclaceae bacterium]MBX3671132.1 peptidase M50 [Rhodocyclaceae bacterium]